MVQLLKLHTNFIISGVVVNDQIKIIELKLSVFVALHCSVKSIDHLGELLKILGKESILNNIKLHRTKCSKLISNVIAPVQLADLIKDIGFDNEIHGIVYTLF